MFKLLSGLAFLGMAGSIFAQSQPEIRSVAIDGQTVSYRVQDGYAVAHGDVILGTVEEVEAAARGGPAEIKHLRDSSVYLGGPGATPLLWTSATMYYTIDPDVPNPQRILDAIQHWNTNTPLNIQPRAGQLNYVRFKRVTADFACSSFYGMRGGEQIIQTTDVCSTGAVIHELGHAFGLVHEQERSDRNAYITVLYQNIDKRFYSDFDQFAAARDVSFYDYGSIMHYGPTGFTRNGLDSLETVPVGIPIGQRGGLSAGDIDSVSRLYGIVPSQTTVTTAPVGLSIVVDGVRAIAPQSYTWPQGSTHTIAADAQQGTDPRYMLVGWSDAGSPAHSVTASSSLTVFSATFQRQERLIAGIASGQGSASAVPVSGDGYYPEREPVLVNATPAPGMEFVRWTGNTNLQANGFGVSSASAIIEVGIPNSAFLASFTSATLTKIVTNPPGLVIQVDGVAYVAPVNMTWIAGSKHTLDLTAIQYAGNNTSRFNFSGWDNGTTATARQVTAGNSDTTFTATFAPQYLLALGTIGTGSVSAAPSTADGFYDAGASVQITAVPGAGQIVRYWLGDAHGGGATQTVTMDQERALAPVFGGALPFRTLNAASFFGNPVFENSGTLVAPYQIVTIFGNNVGPASLAGGQVSGGILASIAGGTSVLFDGVPAPVIYASANQTAVIVPAAVAGKASTAITVLNGGTVVGPVGVGVTPTMPGLFTADASGAGQVVAVNQDGSVNSPSSPAAAGSVVILYATGAGLMDRALPDGQIMDANLSRPQAPVFVRFGKLPGQILYAGSAPGLVNGVLQINVLIPPDLVGTGAVPIQLIAGTYSSPPGTTISVQ